MKEPHRSRASGFTLVELLVMIAIIGILSGIAIVSMIAWRAENQVRNLARSLASDMQIGIGQAIRENATVAIDIMANGYLICIDENLPVGCDAADDMIRSITMPTNFSLTEDFQNNRILINGRGVASFVLDGSPGDQEATVIVNGPGGNQTEVHINLIGRVRLVDN